MTLNQLIQRAASGYPDAQMLAYWDADREEPCSNPDGGDTLARFAVVELTETFDRDVSDDAQIREAVRVLEHAVEDLQGVIGVLDRS